MNAITRIKIIFFTFAIAIFSLGYFLQYLDQAPGALFLLAILSGIVMLVNIYELLANWSISQQEIRASGKAKQISFVCMLISISLLAFSIYPYIGSSGLNFNVKDAKTLFFFLGCSFFFFIFGIALLENKPKRRYVIVRKKIPKK